MIKDIVLEKIQTALQEAIKEQKLGELKELKDCNLKIENPKNPDFGDFAVNVSPLARYARMAPPKIAETITNYIKLEDTETSIVGGFINIKIGQSWLNSIIESVINEKEDFGKNNEGNGEKVLIEYVSANPTGPLHIGHGRWAAMGSALANLLSFSNYTADQEFYINDAGSQINNLAKSLWIRISQELGSNVQIPTEGDEAKGYYPGEYLIDTAKKYIEANKEKVQDQYKNTPDPLTPSKELLEKIAVYAKAEMLKQQKELLEKLNVNFDKFYSELDLHNSGEVENCVETLSKKGEMYEKENAVWFKSSKYGDDQDRVIKKADGSNTYLTADIAYHYDKLKRGYDKVINIWGADHHGYVARLRASIEALGHDPDKLEVLLGQLVNLIISGEQVRMGKRKKMITLEDLVNDVGVDATRYWMIMRSIDTTLDFDVDLAKSSSDENPVFYVQYAHARACSILRNAIAERFDQETKETHAPYLNSEELEDIKIGKNTDLNCLWKESESETVKSTKALILKLESFQNVILNATKQRAPYMIARYAQELASDFHHFYAFSRVLNVENDLMKARLSLVFATKIVLANALGLLGVSTPASM